MNGRAACVVALDSHASAYRSDPVGESAKARTQRKLCAADAVVGNLNDRES